MTRLRVAAAQFATSDDVGENLGTCIEMIDEAADQGAQLVVLPEFCNHLSVYDDAAHCRQVALEIDGRFVASVAARARARRAYVVLTATVRRSDGVTVTNLLLDPDGSLVAQADKQTLMGNERAYLRAGRRVAPVVETPFGAVGMYSCMDGVTCELPRALAVRGARLLTNSLNSFALDEASLHVPARAAENQVFVVAANKVGPLVPADRIEAFGQALGVGAEALHGAGESQIVAPDGTVVAKAPRHGRHIVSAVIDLAEVERVRAADPMPPRRPELYAPLARPGCETPAENTAETLVAAAAAGPEGVQPALDSGARLIVLPELVDAPARIPEGVTVVATRRDGDRHIGMALDASGVRLEQPQLHRTPRLPWACGDGTGGGLRVLDLRWGRLAVAVGDDIRLPEAARLAALRGAAVLAVCYHPARDVDVDLGLVERAAENRLCIVAASPSRPVPGGALVSPPVDSLWSASRSEPYDGTINTPVVERIDPASRYLVGAVHLRRARHREVSRHTDLLEGRSLAAAAVLTASHPS